MEGEREGENKIRCIRISPWPRKESKERKTEKGTNWILNKKTCCTCTGTPKKKKKNHFQEIKKTTNRRTI